MRRLLEKRRRGNRPRAHTVDSRFSNAPYEVCHQHKGNGGLQNAVAAAVRDGKMKEATWIGTCGIPLDSLDHSTYERIERDNPQHKLFGVGGPSAEVQATLIEKLACMGEVAEANTYQSLSTLAAAVHQEHGLVVPRSTLHRWLHDMNYKWGKKKLVGLPAPLSRALIRRIQDSSKVAAPL